MEKINLGRNDLCHCGSNKKYKKCCLASDSELVMNQSRKLFLEAMYEEAGIDTSVLKPFHDFFPDVAEKENRVFWSKDRDPKKDDPYQIIEFYCVDPKCDCNRVMLSVADRGNMIEGTFLSVGFAFNRNDPDPGPYIDPLNPITQEGRSLFPFIKTMLETDFEYIMRLKQHYSMVKMATKGKAFGSKILANKIKN